MVLWFYGSMNAIANCWLLWFYGSVILWMQLLIAGCYVNSFGDRLWDFRGSMWIFLDLCEFFWVIVCGIFVALCVSSVIYVNSFGWSSMEFSVALCESSLIYVNSFGRSSVEFFVALCESSWSMWILLGDRLWNFLGSVWISLICVNSMFNLLTAWLLLSVCDPFVFQFNSWLDAWTSLNWRLWNY